MPRLPVDGGDDNQWGVILNTFLEVSLDNQNPDEGQRGKIKPTAISDAGGQLTSEKGQPDGYASLNESGKVPSTQIDIDKSDIGLGNVDNTSDLDKPVSTATQTALNGKLDTSQLDTDVELTADSDDKIASQKATKNYVNAKAEELVTSSIAESSMGLRTNGLNGWFSALSNVRTNPVDVVIIGDSISVLAAQDSFPMLLLRYFATIGGTSPEGGLYVFARGQLAATTTMSAQGVDSTIGLGGYSALQTNGQTAAYSHKFDAVTVFYTRKPDGGNIEVRVGGASGTLLTTIDTSGTQKSSQSWTSSALTFQTQELHLTAVCGPGETVLLEGVYFHAGTRDRGVRVYSAGHSGWQSSDFTTNPSAALDLIETIQPAITIVATGTNDGSVANPSEYQNEVTDLINAVKTRTSNDIALWVPYINNVFSTAEAELGRQVASDLGVALIDGARNVGDFSSVGDPEGIYSSDNVHPGSEIRRMIAYSMLGVLSGDPIGKLYDTSAKAMSRLEGMETQQTWRQQLGRVSIGNFWGITTFEIGSNTQTYFSVVHPQSNAALAGHASASLNLGDGVGPIDTVIWRETTGQISINRGQGSVRAIRPIKNITSSSYTLVRSDQSFTIECDNTSAQTITIPSNSAVEFPIGTVIYINQHGTGNVSVVPDDGVTLSAYDNVLATAGQYASLMLHKRATDEWVVTSLPLAGEGSSGSSGSIPKPSIITESGAARTLATADAWDYIRLTNATSCNITVPDNTDDPIPVGTQIYLRSVGTGTYTIIEDTAVTVNPPAGGTLVLAGDAALIKIATDEWDLVGATVAV